MAWPYGDPFSELLAGNVIPVGLEQQYLDAIRRSEYAGDPSSSRFTTPFWDVRQWTSGYGTRASGPDERVDRATLERRFDEEIGRAERLVDQFAPGLDEGTRGALSSLTHNAGTRWMQEGLGRAVRNGNWDEARKLFLQYTSRDSELEPGLRARREREAPWIGAGVRNMALPNVSQPQQEVDEFGRPIAPAPQTAPTAPAQPQAAAQAPPGAEDVRNAPPQQAQTWTQWLSEAQNRAFLISAGINMMTPSWGGPMAQIASGIGAGVEAANATQKQEEDRRFAYAQLSSREREGELDRQNRREIADIGAGSRLEVANVRSRAMLERARMIGLRTGAQQNEFTRLVGRLYNTEISSLISPTPAERDAAFQRAMDQATEAMRQAGRGPGGDALPSGESAPSRTPARPGATAPTTSAVPAAPRKGSVEPLTGVSPSPAAPAEPPAGPVTPPISRRLGSSARGNVAPRPGEEVAPREREAPPGATSNMTWEQFIANPYSRTILSNPQQRQQLLRLRPDWAAQIEQALSGR